MREQHPYKHNVEYGEECVETIAPVTKGTIGFGWRGFFGVIGEKRCGKYTCLVSDGIARREHA